ncbi:hypothetical protein SAMN05421812_101712 [Asanoa hainanensis]|uniref:Excreted virulence factor EspC, type VII ESX diderm n=1 Tax=Asanoa hainanensis TaxID=560556 RepID=A0A239H5V2_9ACTN|nr:hypothetical protein [Asanoa hainanensis]SNS76799.1 hypothetical protein SAMN05421812_101712 [Asanoa hainanensis]
MSKHISSEAINAIADHLRQQVAAGPNGVAEIEAKLPATEVGFPGFGVVGIPLDIAYSGFRDRFADSLAAVKASVDDYIAELGRARVAWVEAENASTVVVRD